MISTTVEATVTVAGLHHWPDAPERRYYLRWQHRHLFYVSAIVEVSDDDREVEWHDLALDIEVLFRSYGAWEADSGLLDFKHQSCEQLATRLFGDLARQYPVIQTSVGEDGEFTAYITKENR